MTKGKITYRTETAMTEVLLSSARIRRRREDGHSVDLEHNGQPVRVRWLGEGGLRQARELIADRSERTIFSESPAWDEARCMMVFGDTLRQTLHCIDWPIVECMAKLEKWVVTREHSFPDGSCIDEDDFVWNVRYGGWWLIRHSPDGTIDRHVELPVTRITACGIRGPYRRTLHVTTATNRLNDEEQKNPNEGSLLALDAGVRSPLGYRFDV